MLGGEGRHGADDPRVAVVFEHLGDGDPVVRSGAIDYFARTSSDDRAVREAFLERLKARSLSRLNDERETHRCVSLHSFPWQVQSVGPHIGQFIADTFGASRYQKMPPMLPLTFRLK